MTHPNKDNQAERDDIHIVGCQMASWLAGISRAELAPESWRTSCAELAARWNEVAGDDRTAPPALDAEGLPALTGSISRDDTEHGVEYYTAEQVRQALWMAHKNGIEAGHMIAELTVPTASDAAVAWAVTAPKGGIHKLSITRDSAERKAARWREEWPNNACQVRPLVFGGAAPTSASAQSARQEQQPARASIRGAEFFARLEAVCNAWLELDSSVEGGESTFEAADKLKEAQTTLIAHINAWGGVEQPKEGA